MKKKVCGSKALYVSHLEALQNVVVLHKAYSNANLEEVLSLTSSNAFCVEKVSTFNQYFKSIIIGKN